MKQIQQSLRSGQTEVAAIPRPRAAGGQVLIRTATSLVSAGTERMLVDFGKANWIDKARQQPDKVRMVLEKIATDGLMPTVEAVMRKLDQPLAMGYCNAGVVVAVGNGVTGFAVGDRVASNGKHAEYVSVPVNLCAKLPDTVSDEAAAFTVLGAIALQGIRLVKPTLGECVVVTGLGLIGLMTVQLLRAQGCRVLGLDFDPTKLAMAREFGAETVDLSAGEDPILASERFSRGRGVDAVIITAATKSNEPMSQAARMCRKRGRIVLVGVTGLELSRADFFEKELTFQVSCSYGPGRYDPDYEEKGQDYPVGYVRWTEQRNFEAVLDMLSSGRINVSPLISHRFSIDEAVTAYELIGSPEPTLGVLLHYPRPASNADDSDLSPSNLRVAPQSKSSKAVLGFLGAGNYAGGVLIPAFAQTPARLKTVTSAAGLSGTHVAKKFGIEISSTDNSALLADPEISALVVSTRHDSHARWVCAALAAGKSVFVEKPLALTLDEVAEVERAYIAASERGANLQVMVGFNRRFAPQVQRIAELLRGTKGPKAFVMTVNAGAIPQNHWTQDPAIGGGRIIGEACHFIDLLRFLSGAEITSWQRQFLDASTEDTATIHLKFRDGSIGTINYFANGPKSFPKERLEIFVGGRALQLDNFRKLTGFGWPGFKRMNLWRQDKGQRACTEAFVRSLETGGPPVIPFTEVLEVARVTVQIATERNQDQPSLPA